MDRLDVRRDASDLDADAVEEDETIVGQVEEIVGGVTDKADRRWELAGIRHKPEERWRRRLTERESGKNRESKKKPHDH